MSSESKELSGQETEITISRNWQERDLSRALVIKWLQWSFAVLYQCEEAQMASNDDVYMVICQTLLGIYCITVSSAFVLYIAYRDRFPIAQRLPNVVFLEVLGMIATSVITLANGAFPNNKEIVSCKNYEVIVSFGTNLAYTTTCFRMGWLYLKNFTTRALIQKISIAASSDFNADLKQLSSSTSAGSSATTSTRTRPSCLDVMVERFGVWKLTVLIVSPGIFLGFCDVIFVLVNAPENVALSSTACAFDSLISTVIKSGNFAYLVVIVSILMKSIIKIQDNFCFGAEMRALMSIMVPGALYGGVTIVFSFNSAWQIVFGSLYAGYCCILTIFPVVLSIRHSRQKHTKHLRGAQTYGTHLKSSGNHQIYSELENALQTPEIKSLLFKFLQNEFLVENLAFIDACTALEKTLTAKHIIRKEQLITSIRDIRETFVVETAASSVNISFATRRNLLQLTSDEAISSKSIDIAELMPALKEARDEVFKLIAQDSFGRFKMTEGYISARQQPSEDGDGGGELNRSRTILLEKKTIVNNSNNVRGSRGEGSISGGGSRRSSMTTSVLVRSKIIETALVEPLVTS
eukprot:TRINITY_DN39844_c0_g1_i1.p1 TRINITY_DN39844_c0_g1~~TRINITY_DN39844_c0_g1_i1.p1  ORF type:complete len:578 (-),score=117.47 TRINITY_DN39844_c0_g1_i1:44-1777(-)